MATIHQGMSIVEEECNAIVTHLSDVRETFDVPVDGREKVLEEIARATR